MKSLSDLQRKPVAELLAGMTDPNESVSLAAGKRILLQAREYNLNVRDFLTLAVDPRAGDDAERYAGLSGYEATLAYLNLPFRNAFEQGVVLQAAADTFATYTGTRALFPEVMDDMVRASTRQEQIESVSRFIANSRTINGNEMVSTILDDTSTESTFTIAEGGRIPIRKIGTTEQGIKIWKHGQGYQWTYEFSRRAQLDIITPYAARLQRRIEISKVAAATAILINGDGVNAAATVTKITDYGGSLAGGKTLKDNYPALAKWIMTQWKNGIPIDTLLCNLDTYFEIMMMFAPVVSPTSAAAVLPSVGMPTISTALPLANGRITVEISSSVPADRIIGLIKSECLEELVENGSKISESEQAIQTQIVTYVATENTGYRLVFPEARMILRTDQ